MLIHHEGHEAHEVRYSANEGCHGVLRSNWDSVSSKEGLEIHLRLFVAPSKMGKERSLTLFEMIVVVISSEREKSFFTGFHSF